MIGETIKSIEEIERCGCDEIIITMESGRRFQFVSQGHYCGNSSISWDEGPRDSKPPSTPGEET